MSSVKQKNSQPFWETKKLDELTHEQWEKIQSMRPKHGLEGHGMRGQGAGSALPPQD